MKLKFPTTWTNQKIQVLLLLTLLRIQQVKSGSEFNKCLGDTNYQGIVKHSSSNIGILINYSWTFACLNGTCTNIPNTFSSIDITFQCAKMNQSIFCITTGSSETEMFGGLCGGILGDAPATNDYLLTSGVWCPSLNMVTNALINGPTTSSTFTWLCCDNNLASCYAPSNVTVTNGWATTNCEYGYAWSILMCFADNGGWSCAGGSGGVAVVKKKMVNSIYLGIGQIIPFPSNNSCTLQIAGIGLSKNVLSTTTDESNPSSLPGTTTITTTSAYSTITQTVYANNPALVNATIGLATFSGISLLGWTILSWIFIFKRFFGRVIPTPGTN